VHVYQDPPLLGSFPATLEGRRNIIIAAVVTQREPDSAINDFRILCKRIIIPDQTGIWCDSNSIGVEASQRCSVPR
jgi:hypothetical protein